jgi:surface antigen
MRRSLAALMFLGAVAAASPGFGIGLLNTVQGLGLTNDDFRIASAEAAKLYEAEPVEVGADSIWQNPETGAYGKVEVLAYDGRCVTIEHVFRSGQTKQAHRVEGRRCKGADGVWRIAE